MSTLGSVGGWEADLHGVRRGADNARAWALKDGAAPDENGQAVSMQLLPHSGTEKTRFARWLTQPSKSTKTSWAT